MAMSEWRLERSPLRRWRQARSKPRAGHSGVAFVALVSMPGRPCGGTAASLTLRMAPRRDEGLASAAAETPYPHDPLHGPPAAEEVHAGGAEAAGVTVAGLGLEADWIVVGAGASGCVLASVLARARPDKRVLLLDMGPRLPPPSASKQQPGPPHPQQAEGGLVVSDATAKLVRNPQKWGRLSLGWWRFGAWGGVASEEREGQGCLAAYLSRPQPHLRGRKVTMPRGMGPGGCTLVNAMQYSRGYAEDYSPEQGWPSGGGWSQDDIRQSFEYVESCLSLQQCADSALSLAYQLAAKQRGLWEGRGGPGVFLQPHSYSPMTYMINSKGQGGGERQTAYDAFVSPVLGAGGTGLQVVCGARARRVVIRDGRAVGVRFVRVGPSGKAEGGPEVEVALREGGEVVLCGGALESPRLLMLSGIGDMAHLEALGLPTLVHCEAVGRNLQDHVLAPVMALSLRRWLPASCRAPNAMHGWANLQHHPRHHHHASSSSSGSSPATASSRSKAAFRSAMRSQLIASDFSMSTDIIIECFLPRYPGLVWRVLRWWLGLAMVLVLWLVPPLRWLLEQRVVGFMVCVMNSKSSGTVRLGSGTDPDAPLDIDCQLWSSPEDVSCLALGIRWARHLLAAPALAASFTGPVVAELLPSTMLVPPPPPHKKGAQKEEVKGQEEEEEEEESVEAAPLTASELQGARWYSSVFGGTYFHPVGTCRLGSVVDHRARVKGVAGLRVADVSLLVRPVGAGTVAAAMMIGHRVASIMLQDQQQQPATRGGNSSSSNSE